MRSEGGSEKDKERLSRLKTEKWNSLAIGVVRYVNRSGEIIAVRVAVIEN